MEAENAERQYREDLRRRLSVLPRQAVAWLVLAPEWPQELVSLGFPGPTQEGRAIDGSDAVRTLERASKASSTETASESAQAETVGRPYRRSRPIVQASNALSPWEGLTFRIAAELRAATLEDLLEEYAPGEDVPRPEAGLDYIRDQLQRAAKVMLRSDKLPAYPTLWRWAQLADRAKSDEELRRYLDARVEESIESAESRDEVAAPDALRWIEAAEFFAQIFQGKLELSLTLARRRRELFTRRAYDRRKLANYLPRDDQIDAFHELMDDPDHWALHYVGGGGLGKTMLLRYITHKEARDENGEIRIVTSRVDFDFLNPDYPFRSPGLLLSALAAELRLQAGNDATLAFNAFDASINQLHDEATREPGEMRLIPLDHQLFVSVINAFAKACRILGNRDSQSEPRKVVLMLDTCEELAKLRPDGSLPENVWVTFEVFKLVQARAKNVRVVFSGRRALARKYFGWESESDSELPERPFLRLFVVQGFDEADARKFLENFTLDKRMVPEGFRDSILALTRSTAANEDGRFRRIDRAASGAADRPEPDRRPRHNPYDLDMYAEWAATTKELTLATLRAGGQHIYVEDRILGRLNAEVRRLLPQLALLERFDRVVLDAIIGDGPGAVRLRDEVIAQEWVRADRSSAVDKWLIESRLRQRILDYYQERKPGELSAARQALAEKLRGMTLERKFEELAEQYFSATFEALKEEPEAAAAWWLQVEERIARENAWINWGQPLTSFLLAEPSFSSEATSSFRAAVLATEAAAIIHAAGGDVRATWQRAEAALLAYPAETGRARLEFRIHCGVQALFRQVPDIATVGDDAQCRASWLAAMEILVERWDRERAEWDKYVRLSLDWLHSDPDPYLKAFALSLSARLAVLRGDTMVRSALLFHDALEGAAGSVKQQAWLDWRAPDNLAARIELECVRAWPGLAKEIIHVSVARERPEGTIDDDRLWSAILREIEVPSVPFEPVSVAERPHCNAQRQFSPLAVTLAEKSARTKPVENLQRLRAYSESSKAAGLPDVSLDADRALTRVILRQRMLSENWLIPPAVSDSAAPYDVWLCAVTRALHVSGPAFDNLITALPKYALPDTRTETWLHAESLLIQLELAALRDNELSVKDLTFHAAEAFREIGDLNGVLICHLIEGTWRARTGRSLAAVLKTLQGLPLPESSWESIIQAAQTDNPSFLDQLQPDWRPWIARALAVCAKVKRSEKSLHPRRIVEWLKANHAVEIEGQRVLPVELAFLERTLLRVVRVAKIIGRIIFWVFVAYGWFAIFAALWRLTESRSFAGIGGMVLHGGFALLLAFGGLIVATGIGIGIAFFVKWLSKRFTALSWIASPLTLEYRVEMAGDADANRPMRTPWQARIRARIYYFLYSSETQVSRGETVEERYRFLCQTLAADRGDSIRRAHQFIRRLLMPDIRVSVDPTSAGGPWEAVFGLISPDEERFADVTFRFSRTVSRRTVSAQPDLESPVMITTWIYRGLGVDRASITWRQKSEAGVRNLASEILTRTSDYEQVRFRTGVAHIFGSPVERSSDVFLGVGGVDRGDVAYWISPLEIHRRYPNLRLLIVQASPANAQERSPTDRLQAAQLKRFGALAFQSGIPAVLVLPPLPLPLVNSAMNIVFEVLTQHTGNASRRLILATRRLQDLVGAYPHDSIDVPIELALDICLYVEGRVNLRTRPLPRPRTSA